MQSPTFLAISDLFAGDVLLCYCKDMDQEHIEMRGYSHVAMCLSDHKVLEAGSIVKISTANEILETFG